MQTGSSNIYYPQQPPPEYNLELDNSYFRVKLHDAQAFFEANWLVKPSVLVFSSSVESSLQPDLPAQSLHRITTIERNTPCRLGLNTNLTKWLPARTPDSLKISLQYGIVQDAPIQKLITHLEKMDLVAELALRPDWGAAIKVSKFVGQLLSFLVGEGGQRPIFSLVMDLNVAELKTGYHAVVGSHTGKVWPSSLRIENSGGLRDGRGLPITELSYAVIKVGGLKRLGITTASEEAWCQLLAMGKNQVEKAQPANEQTRRLLLYDWRSLLHNVRELANKQKGYLLPTEIQDIIRQAQTEVDAKLQPPTRGESFGGEELPEAWQDVLGVSTMEQLKGTVRDYQDALAVSQQLLKHYDSEDL